MAAEYANAELVILSAVAGLALKVANGSMSTAVAARRLRQSVVLVMTGVAPRVQALITALMADTLRQALAVHGHQAPEPRPAESTAPWEPPFNPAPATGSPAIIGDDGSQTVPVAQPWKAQFSPERETEPWERDLAKLLNKATSTAEQSARAEFTAVAQAIREAETEPPLKGSPYQAALDKAMNEHGGFPGSTLSARRIRAAQAMLDDLAERGITGFTDRANRKWDLASYAEMATRTLVSEAWDQMQARAAARARIDLADTGTYSQEGSCEKCIPWLGRTLSIFGRTPGYPTLEEAKAAGWKHPSCRCFWVPRGMSAPEVTSPVSPERAAKVYAASQKQRALERRVRAAGRAYHAAVTPQARTTGRRDLKTAKMAADVHRHQHGLIMTKVGVSRRERPVGAR